MIFMLGYKIFLLTMMVETNRIFKNIIEDNKPIVEDISIHKSNNINEKIYIRKTEPYYIMETNLEKFGYNQKANNSNVYFYNNDENIGLAIDNRQNLYEICSTMTQQSFADDAAQRERTGISACVYGGNGGRRIPELYDDHGGRSG